MGGRLINKLVTRCIDACEFLKSTSRISRARDCIALPEHMDLLQTNYLHLKCGVQKT